MAAPLKREVPVVNEVEDLVLLEGAIIHSELHGVAAMNPANAVRVLPGVVAARLRTLVGIANVDAIDQNIRRPGGRGIIRDDSGEAQAGWRSVIGGEDAGLVAAMK